MATIEEALRAARGLAIAFSPAGTLAYSDAQVREFHALLTDRNYHTEAAILLARRMGEEHLAYELERVAALRDERGALRGLSDDGTPLKEKRDALVSEVERLWARGHRRSDAERHEEIELEDALNRAQHALDRAMLAASQRGIYGNRDEGVRAASAQVQAAKSALASARGRYRSHREGNPGVAAAAARSADLTTRRNAAIRALGLDPRSASAHIVSRGSNADVWEVVKHDRYGTHGIGRVSVSYPHH